MPEQHGTPALDDRDKIMFFFERYSSRPYWYLVPTDSMVIASEYDIVAELAATYLYVQLRTDSMILRKQDFRNCESRLPNCE